MPNIGPSHPHQEEKCVGYHYVGEHCVFDDKIKDQLVVDLS